MLNTWKNFWWVQIKRIKPSVDNTRVRRLEKTEQFNLYSHQRGWGRTQTTWLQIFTIYCLTKNDTLIQINNGYNKINRKTTKHITSNNGEEDDNNESSIATPLTKIQCYFLISRQSKEMKNINLSHYVLRQPILFTTVYVNCKQTFQPFYATLKIIYLRVFNVTSRFLILK